MKRPQLHRPLCACSIKSEFRIGRLRYDEGDDLVLGLILLYYTSLDLKKTQFCRSTIGKHFLINGEAND